MANGGPYVTDAVERGLSVIRVASRSVYRDILQDIQDLVYRVEDKHEILGSKPLSWTLGISHDYVVVFSYSYDSLAAGIWILMVVKKDALEAELRAIAK